MLKIIIVKYLYEIVSVTEEGLKFTYSQSRSGCVKLAAKIYSQSGRKVNRLATACEVKKVVNLVYKNCQFRDIHDMEVVKRKESLPVITTETGVEV